MTEFVNGSGDLLEAPVDALVNTVNTVGIMGKGIALQFKRAFPANFAAYAKACRRGQVALGEMFVYDNGLERPRWIVNFPTKGHWRSQSRLTDIDHGLGDLARVIEECDITSVALPPLGCGNGGLDWRDVEPLIRRRLAGLSVVVHLFAPGVAPTAAAMRVATTSPELTESRAALLTLLHRYSQRAGDVSLVETQKLMYFLQVAGQPLRLNFVKGRYGPYADALRHVLIRLEGHYLEGYGDGSKPVQESEPIRLLDGAADRAAAALRTVTDNAVIDRIERTLDLTHGFESPYGMELLATVHWCASDPAIGSASDATACVRSWSDRKARMFTDGHIEAAWAHLESLGWLHQSR